MAAINWNQLTSRTKHEDESILVHLCDKDAKITVFPTIIIIY